MTESITNMTPSIPEAPKENDKKILLSVRIEPWLAQELENYGRLHNLNRTDTLHTEFMELLEFKRAFEANPWGTLGGYLKDHPKTFDEKSYPMEHALP